MGKPTRAAVFDMDGLLVDSEPLWRIAELETFAAFGYPLSHEESEATLGLRIDDVVRLVIGSRSASKDVDHALVRTVGDAILARMQSLLAERATALPGATAAVNAARARGLVVAVASSSPRALIETVIHRLALGDAFQVLCSAEDEPFGKPHPAVYLTAAARLGVAPDEAVAFEDSLRGVIAAKAASMRCVAVPATMAPAFAVADVVLPSLAALDDAAWTALFAAR